MKAVGKYTNVYKRSLMVMPPYGGMSIMVTTEYPNILSFSEYTSAVKQTKIKPNENDKMIAFENEISDVYIVAYGTIKNIVQILFHDDDLIFRNVNGVCTKVSMKGKHVTFTHIPRAKGNSELYIECTNEINFRNCGDFKEMTPSELVQFNGKKYK